MESFKALLMQEFNKAGYSATEEQLSKFSVYYEFLIEYNEKVNLTAIVEPLEVIQKHFIDSLFPLKTEFLPTGAFCCDVGTGAGFPGVPLAIMRPDLKMMLFDSLNKRIVFLNELIERLGLTNCQTVHIRAEEAGQNKLFRESFDVVMSRAVARMAVLSELNLPLLRVGGYMLALKGPAAAEELAEAEYTLSLLGGTGGRIIADTSIEEQNHNLVVIKKAKATPKAYPRKSGTPAKSPLVKK